MSLKSYVESVPAKASILKNLGGFAMKGFGDDITLFEVIWDESQEEKSA